MFPCLLLDFFDFFDILVAVFDEGLKADLVIRTASVGSEQKVVIRQKELAFLFPFLSSGNGSSGTQCIKLNIIWTNSSVG